MPQYEFFCRSCQQSFSRTMPFSEYEKGGIACPQCGGKEVEQRFSTVYPITAKKSA